METCHGCPRVLYSAPGGQAWDRKPHSRCSALKVNVPMILGEHEKWLGSEVPPECPQRSSQGRGSTAVVKQGK